MNSPVITFGKYIGKSLKEVPDSYIQWLLTRYEGKSIPRPEIESEAKLRGVSKSFKRKSKGSYSPNGFGHGTLMEKEHDEDFEYALNESESGWDGHK